MLEPHGDWFAPASCSRHGSRELSNVAQQQAQGSRSATVDGAGVTNVGRVRQTKAWSHH
jgi:hypothetical protein